LGPHRQSLDRNAHALQQAILHRLGAVGSLLDSIEARLESTSYRRTLARGFTITRRQQDRQVVTAAQQVSAGEEIVTETAQGEFTAGSIRRTVIRGVG